MLVEHVTVAKAPEHLRLLMCNWSDQEIGEATHGSSELVVEDLPTRVGCDLRRKAGQQPAQNLCSVVF